MKNYIKKYAEKNLINLSKKFQAPNFLASYSINYDFLTKQRCEERILDILDTENQKQLVLFLDISTLHKFAGKGTKIYKKVDELRKYNPTHQNCVIVFNPWYFHYTENIVIASINYIKGLEYPRVNLYIYPEDFFNSNNVTKVLSAMTRTLNHLEIHFIINKETVVCETNEKIKRLIEK